MGCTMSSKNPIELLMFPVPPVKYSESDKKLKFLFTTKLNKIACMFYKINDNKKIIIYSHGNACDIGYMNNFISNLALDTNTNIVSYDYEGYGLSEGKPSEKGCIEAICAVYNYLISKGYSSTDIILYGTSIGTGPSVDLAERVSLINMKLRGVLLQSPYTSIAAVAHKSFEASAMSCTSIMDNPNPFRSSEKIGNIIAPIIIIHGEKDEVIAHSHAVELKNINKSIKLISIPNGTHNNIDNKYYGIVRNSIMELLG